MESHLSQNLPLCNFMLLLEYPLSMFASVAYILYNLTYFCDVYKELHIVQGLSHLYHVLHIIQV